MNRFPGEIRRIGQGHTIVLSDRQRRWFVRWFPVTENKRLAKTMGVSLYKVHALARELCVGKSEEGLAAIKERRIKASVKTNHLNGCYDRKRGRPVSDATNAGRDRRWEEERLGLRENVQKRMKRESPDKYTAWVEKLSLGRKEMVRKEKMRVIYGLPRQTNLCNFRLTPYKRSQVLHRFNAVRKGYILTEDCSEGNPDRYTIFYDSETKRSERFENNCIADGFKIMRWIE